jgi:DNA-binding response OmpR family regulator
VQRDPVRAELVVEYIARFLEQTKRSHSKNAREGRNSFRFAGAIVDPIERTLRHGGDEIHLTPREIELIELLREFHGLFVNYEVLYGEILGRRFRGDTGNMRVLLGKLAASFRSVGLPLRQYIDVMPKTGYRYRERRTAAKT